MQGIDLSDPLRVWVLCLYFMGLNLSNEQIAAELDVDADTLHIMATQLREGEDGDEFHEGHVNTLEGFGSLLRSWLRPPRGISHEKLPLYLGFFEFVHNARRRAKALLAALLAVLVAS